MPVNDKNDAPPHPAWYLVLVVFAVLCSAAIAFFVKGGIGDMNRLENRKQALKQQLKQKRQTYLRLKNREKRLHQDPYLIEELAKQKLGLGRPGEKRIELETDGKNISSRKRSRRRQESRKQFE